MPSISVIVPNYNHARFIRQRLESIYAQTFRDFELIILDDCSTDNSIEVINQIIDEHKSDGIPTRFIINESNSGSPFKQWKKGIELAKGDYIWIAESDDFADSDLLQVLFNFTKNHNLDLCFCQSYETDIKGKPREKFSWGNFYEETHLFDYSEAKEMMTGFSFIPNASAVIFKKNLGTQFLVDIIEYRQSGDWLFWYLILKHGKKYGYISMTLNYFRRHPETTCSKSDKNLKNIEEAFSVLKKFKRYHIPVNTDFWIQQWLKQTGYSLPILLKNNFKNISKSLSKLDNIGFFFLAFYYIKQKFINLFIKLRSVYGETR